MKLMLTSFGIRDENRIRQEEESMFFLMPPVSMQTIHNTFLPDYKALLLCERIVFDAASFDRLKEKPHPAYRIVSETIQALHAEGFVELADYEQILKENKILLDRMLEHDLKLLDQWIDPLRESLDIWQHFSGLSWELIQDEQDQNDPRSLPFKMSDDLQRSYAIAHEVHHLMHEDERETSRISARLQEALGSAQKRRKREYRDALRRVLKSYLLYVNSNLILSNELGVGFHDWNDFQPFYKLKFLSIGRNEIEAERHINESHKLFEITFPELSFLDSSSLIKTLKDRRIISLRELVQNAVEGKVSFDENFAKNVLREVLQLEKRTRRYRTITSYLTMPIGFIPWIGTPAQKLIEEAVGTPLENKLKNRYKWLYLLSDLSDQSKRKDKNYSTK